MDELNSQGEVSRDDSFNRQIQDGQQDLNCQQNNTYYSGINQQNVNGSYNPYNQQNMNNAYNPYNEQNMNNAYNPYNQQNMNNQYNMNNPYNESNSYYNNPYVYNSKHRGRDGQAIASMILGILSLIFSWIFPKIVLCAGTFAILLAIASLCTRKTGNGMAIAGMVMAVIGVGGAIFILVLQSLML